MKKSLLAMSILFAAGTANAAPFYLDVGLNNNAGKTGQVCATCTSMKNELLFTYQSSTTITDTNGSLTINAGDALTTNGGLSVGPLSNNQITGFTPNEVFGANSNNGYGSSWLLSFSVTGLNGIVTGVSPLGVPLFTYGPGLLELFITFNGTTFNNFMDIAITGGGATGVSTILTGTADFTSVDAGYNNLFHSGTTTCLGSDSFFDIATNCGSAGLDIEFFASFDTNIFVSDFSFNPATKQFSLTSDHDGSATFQVAAVPEPGTLALLGGSLLLLGGMVRRNKKA